MLQEIESKNILATSDLNISPEIEDCEKYLTNYVFYCPSARGVTGDGMVTGHLTDESSMYFHFKTRAKAVRTKSSSGLLGRQPLGGFKSTNAAQTIGILST